MLPAPAAVPPTVVPLAAEKIIDAVVAVAERRSGAVAGRADPVRLDQVPACRPREPGPRVCRCRRSRSELRPNRRRSRRPAPRRRLPTRRCRRRRCRRRRRRCGCRAPACRRRVPGGSTNEPRMITRRSSLPLITLQSPSHAPPGVGSAVPPIDVAGHRAVVGAEGRRDVDALVRRWRADASPWRVDADAVGGDREVRRSPDRPREAGPSPSPVLPAIRLSRTTAPSMWPRRRIPPSPLAMAAVPATSVPMKFPRITGPGQRRWRRRHREVDPVARRCRRSGCSRRRRRPRASGRSCRRSSCRQPTPDTRRRRAIPSASLPRSPVPGEPGADPVARDRRPGRGAELGVVADVDAVLGVRRRSRCRDRVVGPADLDPVAAVALVGVRQVQPDHQVREQVVVVLDADPVVPAS